MAAGQPSPSGDAVDVVFLETVPGTSLRAGELPLLRGLDESDPRVHEGRRLLDNEAARFVRRLLARVWEAPGLPARRSGSPPPLLICLERGAGRLETGLRLAGSKGIDTFARTPYLRLDLKPERLSLTLLHEGARMVHALVRGGGAIKAPWTALPHSTFAVTDPITALDEGYAIHMETLWGHFGSEPGRTGYYHRTAPAFESASTLDAEFFSPARDLLSFTQNFAHYGSVRDGMPAFEGVIQGGGYVRSIYDPARDRATLRRPNAMISCEGVCASVLFWIAVTWAIDAGAAPGQGLEQPGVLAAELAIARMLAAGRPVAGEPFRPDLIDAVAAAGPIHSAQRRQAAARLIDMTRGVTARPELRAAWSSFYNASLSLDEAPMVREFQDLEVAREAMLKDALVDDEALRAAIGPVLPVEVRGQSVQIRGLGAPFPLRFDLNALGEAELSILPRVDRYTRLRIGRALDRGAFLSLDDFADRVGIQPEDLDLIPAHIVLP